MVRRREAASPDHASDRLENHDPMRHLMMAVLSKRMIDGVIAKRLGLMPPA
jgi:hypothetical protein